MLKDLIIAKAKEAQSAARLLAGVSTETKNQALLAMAQALVDRQEDIFEANRLDVDKGHEKGLSKTLIDRLTLNPARIEDMAEGLRQLVALPDPVGEVVSMWTRPNGIQIGQRRVPLGVVAMIYEARPNVTVDAASLCLKTGNACLLRGGSEAINSNKMIAQIISEAATGAGVPRGAITLIEETDREAVTIMLRLNQYIDVIIPRGGAGLIQHVVQNATVPVIETGVGNCHVFVDESADLEMGKAIVVNAKTHRPGVCNAAEKMLIHKEIAAEILPSLAAELEAKGVEIRGCAETLAILPNIKEATEEDWGTEYLDLIIACKVVNDLEQAIDHINRYGSKHSEAIVTENYTNSQRFLNEVDAAAVYVNASTRFTDGFQFGFGAEIGISTQKLHARGPMGLKELTTIKYVIFGSGQIRD